ncbi:MAG: hypothetical protein V1914_04390 [archaeon]
MVSKRGEGLSLNFIIVAILALIVLIVVALFFTGGITKLFGTEQDVSKVSLDPQLRLLAESNCELHCTNQNDAYMSSDSIPKELVEAGYTDCEKLIGKSFSVCKAEKSCQRADPLSGAQCTGTNEMSCETVDGCVWA